MLSTQKRVCATVLILCMALALMLTACSNGGNTSPNDTNTPSVSDTQTPGTATPSNTPGATDPTPDNSTEPDNTPAAPKDPVVLLPDPENINEEEMAGIDRDIANINEATGIDVDNAIEEAYEKYGRYLNENISKNCVKIGLTSYLSWNDTAKSNLGGITSDASKMVNDFLKTNGEEPLDVKDPEQNIAMLWIAASMYYDPSILFHEISLWNDNNSYLYVGEDFSHLRFDIAVAFALAKYINAVDTKNYRDIYISGYNDLFNISHH